jgi:hypothetical protein
MTELIVKKKLNKSAGVALLLLCFFSSAFAAQPRGGKPGSADENIDFNAIRKDIVRFEEALDENLGTLSRHPLFVLNSAKGAYLPGYGLNFSFRINPRHGMMSKLSGRDARRPQVTPEQKKQWIDELNERLKRLIQDNGRGFQQIRKEDYISIVVYIDDRGFPFEPTSATKTVILRVLKKDLDELGNKSGNSQEELNKRIKIFEY